jgi:hypothetical protein
MVSGLIPECRSDSFRNESGHFNAGGYPGVTDGYQVNFQVPAATVPGVATLSLVSGFIAGAQVTIPVQ